VDDVGIFLQPVADEIDMVLDILQLFGNASGLNKCAKEQCPFNPMFRYRSCSDPRAFAL